MSEGATIESTGTALLDQKPGELFPSLRWLSARRLALFLVFWISIFFAGSVLVNNPFAGSSSASAWDLGASSPNYYWVVMYLHGLNTGLVGLAALVACDYFAIPSIHVRRGIVGGVLIAGVLAPIGAVFNTSAPWTNAGLWVQVIAFLALDEIVILFLWGMLSIWREGAPRSRTFPFITASLAGGVMLVAALMGHIAGTILGFGNNPALLGEYANQEMGVSLSDWANSLIGAHSYLMITAVPAGVMALAAVRFGYYRLEGWTKRVAQFGFLLVCVDLVAQTGMALLLGFSSWPGNLPPEIAALPGVPSFLALNDASTFVFLVLGGVLLLGALLLARGVGERWRLPSALPLRALPLLMLALFTVLTTVTEPSDGTAIGTPPEAWLRLFVAFYLTMLVVLVVLLAERLLAERQQIRIGWTAAAGSLVTFAGVMIYVYTGSFAGGVVAVVGLLLLGFAFLTTTWWGLTAKETTAEPVTPPVAARL